jgi:hypothetical protein
MARASLLDVGLWYARRLRAMDAREIAHRVVEAARKTAARFDARGWRTRPGVRLRDAPAFARAFDPARIDEALRRAILETARRLLEGRTRFLGRDHPSPGLPPPPAWWASDARGEASALERRFAFDALRRAQREGRDLKRIWEPNRLQFLPTLALASRLSENEGARATFRQATLATIAAWMAAHPPFKGLAYAGGIEAALRIVSVATAVSILGCASLEVDERRAVEAFLATHADWIARFPSLGSSANNHRVAELAGLVVAAAMLEGREGARAHGAAFEAVLIEQFHADGVGAEQSPTYAAFVAELALVAFAAQELGPGEARPAARARLAAFAEATLWTMNPQGAAPSIGDDDGGRVLALGDAQEDRYVASVLALLAAWLEAPWLAPPTRPPSTLRDLLFGRPDRRPGPGAPVGLRHFPEGGITVSRWARPRATLLFDHGPVGHLSIAAHGHADTLAVWLDVEGRPVFCDAGTATYDPHDALREALRLTGAHNAPMVGGVSSSLPSGPFHWAKKAKPATLRADDRSARASHDGYARRFGLRPIREIRRRGDEGFDLIDELEGGAGDVRAIFHLGAGCEARSRGPDRFELLIDGRPALALRVIGPLAARVSGVDDPDAAIVATRYGETRRCARLILEGRLSPGLRQTIEARFLREAETA